MNTPTWISDSVLVDDKICKKSIFEIVEDVSKHQSDILESFDKEAIDVTLFLKNELKTDVSKNLVFQFVFRSFYRIDNAGLSKNFKKKYFEVLELIKHQKICFKEIDKELEKVSVMLKDKKKSEPTPSLQFSFMTKMIGMLCDDCPIYDSEVARVFGYDYVSNGLERGVRLDTYIQRHLHIYKVYNEILEKEFLKNVLTSFKKQFGCVGVNDIKILDFIFWQTGKQIFKGEHKDKANTTDKVFVLENNKVDNTTGM